MSRKGTKEDKGFENRFCECVWNMLRIIVCLKVISGMSFNAECIIKNICFFKYSNLLLRIKYVWYLLVYIIDVANVNIHVHHTTLKKNLI